MSDIEAIINFTKSEEGGRKYPVFSGYRPAHLVKEDYLTTGVHHYYDREKVELGEAVLGTITFITPEAYPNCLWVDKNTGRVPYCRLCQSNKIFNSLLESK